MLTGAGGVGKTFLALGMAAAAGNGGGPIMPKPPYVNTIPPQIGGGQVVYLSWEDEAEEAARRVAGHREGPRS